MHHAATPTAASAGRHALTRSPPPRALLFLGAPFYLARSQVGKHFHLKTLVEQVKMIDPELNEAGIEYSQIASTRLPRPLYAAPLRWA